MRRHTTHRGVVEVFFRRRFFRRCLSMWCRVTPPGRRHHPPTDLKVGEAPLVDIDVLWRFVTFLWRFVMQSPTDLQVGEAPLVGVDVLWRFVTFL